MTALFLRSLAGPSRLPAIIRPQAAIAPQVLAGASRAGPSIRQFSSSPIALDKLKSHSGAKKRFFRTGGGLWKRGQAGKRHINTLFSAGRINRLAQTAYLDVRQSKVMRKLLPYA